jgi:hypothetical protein
MMSSLVGWPAYPADSVSSFSPADVQSGPGSVVRLCAEPSGRLAGLQVQGVHFDKYPDGFNLISGFPTLDDFGERINGLLPEF